MVTRHLLAQGHKRVGYLGYANSRRNPERMAGVREALAAQDLELSVFEAEAPVSGAGEKLCSSIMLGRQQEGTRHQVARSRGLGAEEIGRAHV